MCASVTEGHVDFKVPALPVVSQTWYKIIGDLKRGVRPLIALHGGPGVNSRYLEILSDVTKGRPGPLIVYDQIGNGNSTHFPEKIGDTKFWTEGLFLGELNNLITKLDIKEYDLFGHSWGGMLGARHATQHPPGLKHLILMSSPASMELWVQSVNGLRAKLPADVRRVLDENEENGTTESPEYQEAVEFFYSRHLIRIDPTPEAVAEGFATIASDPTVYLTMNGPNEFSVSGSLRNWTIVSDIPKIQVPTLVTNGAHDEAQDIVVLPYVKRLPHGKWVKFLDSAHMAHYEEREKFMKTVADFLYSGQ
ncbi:hypothetical protein NMY22_g16607 [Coprinellus aureogranulatus]|nr:hypothetical protein NMY22_g16607 [Coprinellus aureogranulatus]